jgi:prenyltransferase beta subunit
MGVMGSGFARGSLISLCLLLTLFLTLNPTAALNLSVSQVDDKLKITLDEPAFIVIRQNNGVPIYAYGTEIYYNPYISGNVIVNAITENERISKEIEFSQSSTSSTSQVYTPTINYWWSGIVKLPLGFFKKESEDGKVYKIDWRTALGALDMASRKGNFDYVIKSTEWGPFVKCIAGKCEKSEGAFSGWMYQVNGETPSVGSHEYPVREGDEVVWFFVKTPDGTPGSSSRVLRIFVFYNNTVWGNNETTNQTNRSINQSINQSANQKANEFPLSIYDSRIIRALSYLKSLQQENGGFANPSEEATLAKTSWVVMTMVAAKQNPKWWKKDNTSAIDYIGRELKNQIKYMGTADYARMILALYAVGKDPRSFGGVDLVDFLKSKVKDSGQIGDFTYTTIWGLMALKVSGEDVSKTVKWLINQQNDDGGFGWAPEQPSDYDDTAAAIQALVASNVSCDSDTIRKAFEYLKTGQNDDGGFRYFGNSSSNAASDSWIIQAIVACNGNPLEWEKNNRSVVDHLLSLQQPDGSFNYTTYQKSNPGYMTASAIMSLLGKPFPIKPTKWEHITLNETLRETKPRETHEKTPANVTKTENESVKAVKKNKTIEQVIPTAKPTAKPTEEKPTPKSPENKIPGFEMLIGISALAVALWMRRI